LIIFFLKTKIRDSQTLFIFDFRIAMKNYTNVANLVWFNRFNDEK
jgi:hypothetical protein